MGDVPEICLFITILFCGTFQVETPLPHICCNKNVQLSFFLFIIYQVCNSKFQWNIIGSKDIRPNSWSNKRNFK